MKTQIGITFEVVGFHNWPHAPQEVSFLQTRHRHKFFFECVKSVDHDDRDVEFTLLKMAIENHVRLLYYNPVSCNMEFGSLSCEAIATEILKAFDLDECKVWEDMENYGKVTK